MSLKNKSATSNNEPNKSVSKSIYKQLLDNQLIEDYNLTSSIFKGFIFIGIITKIIFSISDISDVDNGAYGPASVSIWSYGIIIFSFIVIMFLKILNDGERPNILGNFNFIILIILLLWIITINVKHFKKINSLKIPENYWNYEYFSTVIIIIHTCFYIYTVGNQNDENYKKVEFIIWLLIFLNFFLILIQQIILDSFTVDIL